MDCKRERKWDRRPSVSQYTMTAEEGEDCASWSEGRESEVEEVWTVDKWRSLVLVAVLRDSMSWRICLAQDINCRVDEALITWPRVNWSEGESDREMASVIMQGMVSREERCGASLGMESMNCFTFWTKEGSVQGKARLVGDPEMYRTMHVLSRAMGRWCFNDGTLSAMVREEMIPI